MNKLETRKLEIRKQVEKALRPIDKRTIGTREILEYALKNAQLFKIQKVLMMAEIMARLNDGEYS